MDLGIAGRKAIVCASSFGLGRGCAQALAREGVAVVLNGRVAEDVERAAEALRQETGSEVTPVAGDVATEPGRAALLAACPDPDILVNNCGGPLSGDFRDFLRDDWIAALDANMLSAIELMKATVDGMIQRGFGRVVNITSGGVKPPRHLPGPLFSAGFCHPRRDDSTKILYQYRAGSHSRGAATEDGSNWLPSTPGQEIATIGWAPCPDDEGGYAVPGPNRPRRARFWLPVLSLFHGVRLNEAAQLSVDDVEEVDGATVIHVRPGPGKKLKSDAARRRVALHPEVRRMGLACRRGYRGPLQPTVLPACNCCNPVAIQRPSRGRNVTVVGPPPGPVMPVGAAASRSRPCVARGGPPSVRGGLRGPPEAGTALCGPHRGAHGSSARCSSNVPSAGVGVSTGGRGA